MTKDNQIRELLFDLNAQKVKIQIACDRIDSIKEEIRKILGD